MAATAKTIWSGKLGKLDLGIVLYQGIYHSKADGKVVAQAASEDEAKRLLYAEVGKLGLKYFGFDGAKQRFESFFPDGFHSLRYDKAERNYKVAAKAKLDANVPLEVALSGHGDGRAVTNAISHLNLLQPQFEAPRFSEMLQSNYGPAFLASAARFTVKPSQQELSSLTQLLKPYPALRWAAVTLLPFLWRPDEHLFLKPEITRDFAERVGHPYAHIYEPSLSLSVYESLIDLGRVTKEKLADMAPRDGVDIQSFIFVVGGYSDRDRTS
jgi:hypothetical protein